MTCSVKFVQLNEIYMCTEFHMNTCKYVWAIHQVFWLCSRGRRRAPVPRPGPSLCGVLIRGLHGSKNSYPSPKRPVNVLRGTDPDPYFIWKWDPNPCRPEKCLKCTTRTRRGPDHYSKVGPEPGWEDTDPTVPVPIGTYCTANAMKSINVAKKKNFLP